MPNSSAHSEIANWNASHFVVPNLLSLSYGSCRRLVQVNSYLMPENEDNSSCYLGGTTYEKTISRNAFGGFRRSIDEATVCMYMCIWDFPIEISAEVRIKSLHVSPLCFQRVRYISNADCFEQPISLSLFSQSFLIFILTRNRNQNPTSLILLYTYISHRRDLIDLCLLLFFPTSSSLFTYLNSFALYLHPNSLHLKFQFISFQMLTTSPSLPPRRPLALLLLRNAHTSTHTHCSPILLFISVSTTRGPFSPIHPPKLPFPPSRFPSWIINIHFSGFLGFQSCVFGVQPVDWIPYAQ